MDNVSITPQFDKRVKKLDGVYGKIKVTINDYPMMIEKIAVICDEKSEWNHYSVARTTVYKNGGAEHFMPNTKFKLNGSRE